MWDKIKKILKTIGGKAAVIKDGEDVFVVVRYEDFMKIVYNRPEEDTERFLAPPAREKERKFSDIVNQEFSINRYSEIDQQREGTHQKMSEPGGDYPQLRDLPV